MFNHYSKEENEFINSLLIKNLPKNITNAKEVMKLL